VWGIVAPFLQCGPCGSYQRIWGWALRLTWSSVPGSGHGAYYLVAATMPLGGGHK
jgi:hypothetical protein